MKLIEIIITAGIIVCLILTVASLILFSGIENMLGGIIDIVLEAVGRIGRAWRGN